ncbi:hypothetical protein [Enterovirga sp. CN4-39]|uniref:hypothetical protein n=1 Tax=Enterovirga sp. CN4-39 TaxID=3400910 RepID=UPI003C05B4AD
MNAPETYRSILRHHVASIEAKYPLKIVGLLPSGTLGHWSGEEDAEFLAERGDGLSILGLSGAEVDLGILLGKPVRIVLVSELHGSAAEEIPARASPL